MKFTKTNVLIAATLVAITSITSIAASTAFVQETSQHAELERALRLSNLSVIAVRNGDYALACRAQRELADAVVKAHAVGPDLYTVASQYNKEFCQRAGV